MRSEGQLNEDEQQKERRRKEAWREKRVWKLRAAYVEERMARGRGKRRGGRVEKQGGGKKKDKCEGIAKKRATVIHVSQAALHHPVFTSS